MHTLCLLGKGAPQARRGWSGCSPLGPVAGEELAGGSRGHGRHSGHASASPVSLGRRTFSAPVPMGRSPCPHLGPPGSCRFTAAQPAGLGHRPYLALGWAFRGEALATAASAGAGRVTGGGLTRPGGPLADAWCPGGLGRRGRSHCPTSPSPQVAAATEPRRPVFTAPPRPALCCPNPVLRLAQRESRAAALGDGGDGDGTGTALEDAGGVVPRTHQDCPGRVTAPSAPALTVCVVCTPGQSSRL